MASTIKFDAKKLESALRFGMHDHVYLNGAVLPKSEAHISPFDHGLTVGDGVFESLITYDGQPFAVRRHWERLVRSAEIMGLAAPGLPTFQNAVAQLIDANELKNARLRITLTGGEAPLGSEKSSTATQTFLVASMDLPQRPPLATVMTVPWTRNERGALNQVKSTSYGENVIALAAAKAAGAQEAIFANTRGELCEGTGSNIFLVINGVLHTPPLSSGCLAGVTRAIVLKLCQAHGITVDESPLPLDALYKADEAFLTSTYREVQPIAKADHRNFSLAPGPITAALQAAFKEELKRTLEP